MYNNNICTNAIGKFQVKRYKQKRIKLVYKIIRFNAFCSRCINALESKFFKINPNMIQNISNIRIN